MIDINETDLSLQSVQSCLTRLFGWLILTTMLVFLINTVLTLWVGLPGVGSTLGWIPDGDKSTWGWLQVAIYPAAFAATFSYVLRTPHVSLRADADHIADINSFLIRAAFWIVLLVGLVDGIISFLRVEGLLPTIVGEELSKNLNHSRFRSHWVHVPLALMGIAIATKVRSLGFIWLSALVVIAELIIVFSRFILSYEQAFMGDLVRFWYAALFLFASAYTLQNDGHVRIDLFYANARRQTKGKVNAIGSVLLGMSLCWTILLLGMSSKSSVIAGPILVYETTQTGFGMYVKYLMAGFLGVFAVSMMIQFVSELFKAVADIRNEPGGNEQTHVVANA